MTAEGHVFPQDLLRVTTHRPDDGGLALVLDIAGELDLLTAPLLEDAVAAALADNPDPLVVDLTGVSFLASVGMTVLLKAQRTAAPHTRLRVVAPERSVVARTLQLTGLLEVLAVVPTVTDALTRWRPAVPESAPDPCLPETVDDLRCVAVPAVPDRLVRLREQLDQWAVRTGLDPESRQAVLLAAYEAMANVVVHAYRGADGVLDLCASSRGDVVVVTVADHGRWQPVSRPGPLHGRRLPLIRSLAVDAVVDKTAAGTTVTMSFAR